MTLDELLALLPDNTSGEITAGDLRTIVTELWNFTAGHGHVSANSAPFRFETNQANFQSGELMLTGGWSATVTEIVASDNTADGSSPAWTDLAAKMTPGTKVRVRLGAASSLTADVAGALVVAADRTTIPVSAAVLDGPSPAKGDEVMLDAAYTAVFQ